ncbi:hypothetical protein B0O99DRAFT_636292 [Bisporella sp. PMI_857]|nr:hypothetical protein B0O99DRAFT_636292 [Bisporella sp. PMI_857]
MIPYPTPATPLRHLSHPQHPPRTPEPQIQPTHSIVSSRLISNPPVSALPNYRTYCTMGWVWGGILHAWYPRSTLAGTYMRDITYLPSYHTAALRRHLHKNAT